MSAGVQGGGGGFQVQWWHRPGVVIVCGCLIAIISFGVRSSFGLFTEPLTITRGWSREVFAFAIAIQNLIWGVGQPFAGAIADRFGSALVLAVGGLLYAAGVALMAVSTDPISLQLTAGVLVGLGLAGGSFTIVISAFTRLVPVARRSWAMGIATATGSLGQFLFAPLGQAFISGYGWITALLLLSLFVALIPVLAIALGTPPRQQPFHDDEPDIGFLETIGAALRHGSYLLLIAGFFVCGFHVAFITTHLPPYLADVGIAPSVAAWAIALVGLFNVVGSYSSGVLGGRFSKRYLLSGIYLARAAVIALFMVMPMSTFGVLVFAAGMGLLWLSTVPLTAGLVAIMFGTRYMASLFGFVFFSHQVGAFLGVWLGGLLYDETGSYQLVWWISIALGVFAAVVHWPIAETRAPRFAPAAA